MILKTAEETKQFGKNFAKNVQSGGIICLYGDLGAGKTTFTQGLAVGLGISHRIISPTFVIVRTYHLSRHSGKRTKGTGASASRISQNDKRSWTSQDDGRGFYHIDLYRTNSEQELIDIGLQEIFSDQKNIVVVEWAEKLGSLLPEKKREIHFRHLPDGGRRVKII